MSVAWQVLKFAQHSLNVGCRRRFSASQVSSRLESNTTRSDGVELELLCLSILTFSSTCVCFRQLLDKLLTRFKSQEVLLCSAPSALYKIIAVPLFFMRCRVYFSWVCVLLFLFHLKPLNIHLYRDAPIRLFGTNRWSGSSIDTRQWMNGLSCVILLIILHLGNIVA